MRKLILLMSILMGIVLVAVPAHAGDWMLGFSAGTAIPRDEFEGRATLGLIGGVRLDYWATAHLALGVDGSFVRFGDEALSTEAIGTPVTVTLKSRMLQGGAHLKYMVTQTTISPFVVVGLGAYKLMDDSESSDPMFDSHGGYHTFLGTLAGLGLMCRTSDKVSIGVEGVLHAVWTAFSWNAVEAREFISIQTGVSIGMGNPED